VVSAPNWAGWRLACRRIREVPPAIIHLGPTPSLKQGQAEQLGQRSRLVGRECGKANRMAQAINTGVVWVNTYNNFDPAMPFGGTKMSGGGTSSASTRWTST
jgi:hypothetical protein